MNNVVSVMPSGSAIGNGDRVMSSNVAIRISKVSGTSAVELMSSGVWMNSNARVSSSASGINDETALRVPGIIRAERRNPETRNGAATRVRIAMPGDAASRNSGASVRTIFARANQSATAGGKSVNGRFKVSEGRTTGVSTKAIGIGCAAIRSAFRVSPISITGRRATAIIATTATTK